MDLHSYFEEKYSTVQPEPNTAYIILPPSEDSEFLFHRVIVEALELSDLRITCRQANLLFGPDVDIKNLLYEMLASQYIIVDVSNMDPSVFFQLGIAVLINPNLIILAQHRDEVPTDLSRFYCVEYSRTEDGYQFVADSLYERFIQMTENVEYPGQAGSGMTTQTDSVDAIPARDYEEQSTYEPQAADDEEVEEQEYQPAWERKATPVPEDNIERPTTKVSRQFDEERSEDSTSTQPQLRTSQITNMLKKGLEYKKLGMYEQALNEFEMLKELRPEDSNLYMVLGDLCEEMNNLESAVAYFKQSIGLNPNNSHAYSGLGIVYAKKKQHYDAINAYAEAIRLNPNNASVYSNLGAAYNALGLYDEALQAYEKALALNPDSAKIHYNIGNSYYNKCMYPEAIQSLEEALRINPNYTKAQRNLERAIQKKRQSDVER